MEEKQEAVLTDCRKLENDISEAGAFKEETRLNRKIELNIKIKELEFQNKILSELNEV